MSLAVSVLIPAFRAGFVRQAIASVLTQDYDELEILVSDDNPGDDVREVVNRFGDPRIRYIKTAGATGATANVRALWLEARHDLLKYLFDDDLLLPNALVNLTDQIVRCPKAAFVFGQRDVIDDRGRVHATPRSIAPGKIVTAARPDLVVSILPRCSNMIGEFSNILINRGVGLTLDDAFAYRGFPIVMLNDVALYLNASARGMVIGIDAVVGHFRRHGEQNSSLAFNPLYHKVVGEWELFLRGEYNAATLSQDQALTALETLTKVYGMFIARVPKLAPLLAGLPELRKRISAGDRDVLDDRFRAVWTELA